MKHWALISLAGLLVYFLAVAVRLTGITQKELQADEHHWIERSQSIIRQYHNDPQNLTSHLCHPGIPAAMTMAAGLSLREKLIRGLNLTPDSRWFVDPFGAARIMIALASTLVLPVVFLIALRFLGFWPAISASLLLALDPRHIGLSQQAHLDSFMTLPVTATIALYALAVQKSRFSLKILAGFFWGLCISIKPTAAVLPISFMIYKALRLVILPRDPRQGDRDILNWGDIAAVLTGHLTLVLLYTRLWHHGNRYDKCHFTSSQIAHWVWKCGDFLHTHMLLAAFLSAALFWGAWLLWRNRRYSSGRLQYHLSILLGMLAAVCLCIALFPQVFENLTRFWSRTIGFSRAVHEAYGKVDTLQHPGYLHKLISNLPPVCLIGAALALPFSFREARRKGATPALMFLMLLIISIITWIAPLSVASKQAWRYVLPVAPCIYVLAGYGWSALLGYLGTAAGGGSKTVQSAFLIAGTLAGAALQFYEAYDWHPHQISYFNSWSGGLRGAVDRREPLNFIGRREAMAFLREEARKSGNPVYVRTLVEKTVLADEAQRLFGDDAGLIRFDYWPQTVADYLLVFASHRLWYENDSVSAGMRNRLVFSYLFRGVPVVEIFTVRLPSYVPPMLLRTAYGHRHTGRLRKTSDRKEPVIAAVPGRDRTGHMFFTPGMRFGAGAYRISIAAMLRRNEVSDNRDAFTLYLGEGCKRTVKAKELTLNNFQQIELDCFLEGDGRHTLGVSWPGEAAVGIGNITLQGSPR